jgi:hypothetical protein
MSGLAKHQSAFIAQIFDEDMPLPDGWTDRHATGMAIYRNNYRTALVDALFATFERTARWVGDDAFRQAAAHHVIAHPPSSWSLDDAGHGFDATLAELFAGDPEVTELAWVEWSMQRAFGAEDALPLDAAGFSAATAGFTDTDWDAMRLVFMPRLATRVVYHDIAAIWRALGEEKLTLSDYALDAPVTCHVYREGEQPIFITGPAHENSALNAMLKGASFGKLCALLSERFDPEDTAAEAGGMLGRWLHQGMIRAIN